MQDTDELIRGARSFGEIFSIARRCVYDVLGKRRAGLMLGLSPLGIYPDGFVGAYHQMGTNIIVLNDTLIRKISRTKPEMLNYYIFHLLMHEYLHSLGVTDEWTTRLLTYDITRKVFGDGHILTRIARRFEEFLPNLRYYDRLSALPDGHDITLIDNFEEEDTSYIG